MDLLLLACSISPLPWPGLLTASPSQVVSHSPNGLPQTVVTPLLVPQFVDMMNKEATEEEFKLWQFLGDAWNVPRSESGTVYTVHVQILCHLESVTD